MSFIDNLRTLVSNALVERFENDENIHAVSYRKMTIMASFDGVYSVEVSRIENYKGDSVRPDALAVLLEPHHRDVLVYDKEFGWMVSRRDDIAFFNEDSIWSPPTAPVVEPPVPPAPVDEERITFSPVDADDDMPF